VMRLPGSRIAAGSIHRTTMRALGRRARSGRPRRAGRRSPSPDEPPVDQDCAVVFTSGATGPAKGVVYRHRQVLAQLDLLESTYKLSPDDRLVAAFAPFALLGPALGHRVRRPRHRRDGAREPDGDEAGRGSSGGRRHRRVRLAGRAARRRSHRRRSRADVAKALAHVRLLMSPARRCRRRCCARCRTCSPGRTHTRRTG
jgi:hypothetical protein